ncbi:radical SAM family heme chaperone HemW [Haloferula rosea]|uniref:Heme chaperone HemW n=1 Tax=Haloferula rosea TaxID=490093 RepID=A0A934R649_9BACT|nr:radical SAM family heme chaperone HemW [Haloferula rosea]MBK1826004.1 radical SAM family heme chaperone HemW [Haloferula rosea]
MLIYVHIPFCHRVCPYCSFYKHTPGGTSITGFIDALVAETKSRLSAHTGSQARTLYLGGGTPSMLSPAHLRRLFDGLKQSIDIAALDEVTLEANPATFDQRKATLFQELGVRRVSLGIQSFHPSTLKRLGREHSVEQAMESVETLRSAGMPSINIDLMFSIPGLDLQAWRQTLEIAIGLRPDHISAYNLTYEEDTAFFDQLAQGQLDADPDRDACQFFLGDELLSEAGYRHYETSNYARPGHESSHNQGYWRGEEYLGLGPSAVSTIGTTRSRNIPDTDQYVAMIKGIGHATCDSESLTPEALRIERTALLLRTKDGIPLDGLDPAKVDALIDEKLALSQDGRLVLSRDGSALVDAIVAELI